MSKPMNWNRILAWAVTAIVLPSGGYAAHRIVKTLDELTAQSARVQVETVRLRGDLSSLDREFSTFRQSHQHLRTEDLDDLGVMRDDIREIKRQVTDLTVAIARF